MGIFGGFLMIGSVIAILIGWAMIEGGAANTPEEVMEAVFMIVVAGFALMVGTILYALDKLREFMRDVAIDSLRVSMGGADALAAAQSEIEKLRRRHNLVVCSICAVIFVLLMAGPVIRMFSE